MIIILLKNANSSACGQVRIWLCQSERVSSGATKGREAKQI